MLLVSARLICAQEPSLAEKIRDISPDKKFAMRIWYDAEMFRKMFPTPESDAKGTASELEQGMREQYFSDTISDVELVSLPQKRVVAKLPWAVCHPTLVWSRDSKWSAFYCSPHRAGYTTVYHHHGDRFVKINESDELRVDIEGDVRSEWVEPIRWTQPGVLLLKQSSMVRNDGETKLQFIAAFDSKTGKFRIISKKKIPSRE